MAVWQCLKKRFKKELISGVICAGLLIGAYCGCESYIDKQVQEWNAIEYIGVSNDGIYKNEVNFKTVDEIKAYKPTIDFYSSNIYYNELNSQEKFVYDTIKYAYENNITHLFFEESLVCECDYSLKEILKMFAMDSPIMEQNLVYREDDITYTINNQFLYKPVERTLDGFYINIENFTQERAAKKQKAVKIASKIEFDFTEDMSEFDKAKAIYTYLGENIEYESQEGENQEKLILKTHYLYDAFSKKKTNCDGFANAFSLLCSMNGIKNFEKMNEPPKDETGHTWNAVLLDGVWYNVDATASMEVLETDWTKDLYSRFAFSDKAQTAKPLFSKIYPACKEDTIFIGCTLKACDEDGAVRRVAEAFRSSEDDVFVVVIKDKKATEDEIDDLLQGVADYLRTSFNLVTVEGADFQLIYINK